MVKNNNNNNSFVVKIKDLFMVLVFQSNYSAGWGPSGQLTYTYVNVVPIKRYRDDGCYQNYDKNLVIAHDEYGQSGPSLVRNFLFNQFR